MPTPIVIDLSHHNIVPTSLQPAKDSGIIGVIHKATEGASYVDDMLDNRWYFAKQAGLLWGTYHFMRPGDQKAHAKHYVDVTNANGDKNTLLCADHEDTGVSLTDLKTFLREVERLTGRKPIIYSGHVLKQQLNGHADADLSTYKLWLAQYAAQPTLPPGFSKYWLWQYTDNGSVPGVTPPTDLDAGDKAAVSSQWSGAATPGPDPEPEPDAGEVSVDLTIGGTPGTVVHLSINGGAVATVTVGEDA